MSQVEPKRSISSKVRVLQLARELNNVSRACKIMGFSRDSYYRFKRRYDSGGEAALHDRSRRKPIFKNRVHPELEAAILKLALEHPAWGQERVARALMARKFTISPGGVRCVWLRHNLCTVDLRLTAQETRALNERTRALKLRHQRRP